MISFAEVEKRLKDAFTEAIVDLDLADRLEWTDPYYLMYRGLYLLYELLGDKFVIPSIGIREKGFSATWCKDNREARLICYFNNKSYLYYDDNDYNTVLHNDSEGDLVEISKYVLRVWE